MSIKAAFQFLTIARLGKGGEINPEALGRSTAYFPLVGLAIGLMLAGLYWVLSFVLAENVMRVLLIAALVVMTGALHLDGLADTCDGMAGHKPVEDRWKIMRDSHTGAFGVVGITLVLLVKYAALTSIPITFTIPILIFVPVVSRWAMVYGVFAYPYARESGLGTAFKKGTRWPQFTGATLICLAVAVVLFPIFSISGLILMIGIWIVTVLLANYFKRKFTGLTGDTYGAINEIAEASSLVLASLIFTVASNLRI
jgi:adenosylcobinamide-GDP ribazoletransferase